MPLPKPTPANEKTGPQLAEALASILHRCRDRLNRYEWGVLNEASRRLNQHEYRRQERRDQNARRGDATR